MNYQYIIVSNIYYFNSSAITFYGIAAVKEDAGRNEIIDVIFDLSSDFEEVKRLVDICNEQKLDAVHLHDVAQDLITV